MAARRGVLGIRRTIRVPKVDADECKFLSAPEKLKLYVGGTVLRWKDQRYTDALLLLCHRSKPVIDRFGELADDHCASRWLQLSVNTCRLERIIETVDPGEHVH